MKGLGNLPGERKRVEWLEQDGGDPKISEPSLVDSLNLGGEQKHRDMRDLRRQLHVSEGRWAVYIGHHNVHQYGIRLVLLCQFYTLRA